MNQFIQLYLNRGNTTPVQASHIHIRSCLVSYNAQIYAFDLRSCFWVYWM